MNQIKKLLPYLNRELTTQDLNEIETLLTDNPAYFEILGGLALMKKEFGTTDAVNAHLKEKKEEIRERLFADAMKLSTF